MAAGRDDSAPGVGPAAVASFDDIGSGDSQDAPVARFDAEDVAAAGAGAPVAALGAAVIGPADGPDASRRRRPARGSKPAAGAGPVTGVPLPAGIDPPAGADPPVDPPSDTGSPIGGPRDRRGRSRRRTDGDDRGERRRARPERDPDADPDADPEAAARAICLRLLTDRARTRLELAQALKRKGVPDEAANAVLARYGEVGLIDDAAFAGQWVRSRHTGRGLGRRAIAVELRRKGVADDVAGEALAEVDTASEEVRARQLVDRKLRSMSTATPEERAVAVRRLAGMLARKGYTAGVAFHVVRRAIDADLDELGEPVAE